jgi:hypothetical protein
MDNENNAMGQETGRSGQVTLWAVFGLMGALLYFGAGQFTTFDKVKAATIGYALMVGNLLFLSVAWSWILKKKFIALTTPLIVLKYALLGLILFVVVKEQNLDFVWFAVGFIWFFTSIVLAGVINHIKAN